MNWTHETARKHFALTAALVAAIFALPLHAATPQTIGSGTMQHSEVAGGPATLLMRTLTIAPGEVLGWHHHPGIGAYTIVVSGTLVVEDGCGGEAVYSQGQAFLEPPGRVHRGKNQTGANVVTAQTFLVPLGTPTSVSYPQRTCGVPLNVQECKDGGWQMFELPRLFVSQGDCIGYVMTGD